MNKPMGRKFLSGAAVGGLISIPWLTITSAGGMIAHFPVVPFLFFEWLARSLPGSIITLGVETMVNLLVPLRFGQTADLAKALEVGMAFALAWVLLTILAGTSWALLAPVSWRWQVKGSFQGLLLAISSVLFTLEIRPDLVGVLWMLGISLAWGYAAAWGSHRMSAAISAEPDQARRIFLGKLAITSVAFSGLALGLSRWFTATSRVEQAASRPTQTIPPQALPTAPPANAGFQPVAGTRPEITAIADFYRVDINLLPPGDASFLEGDDSLTGRLLAQGGETDLPAASFRLKVEGLVEQPLSLSLTDLKSYPIVEQYATLACISNPIGGDLISTTVFQGARLKDVLEAASLLAEARDIKFTCVDGYTESLPVESALDPRTLLCYAMGGQPLTREHGFPLRLYTPDRFGMKNPKWIIKIEAVAEDYRGFWEQRGWSEDAWVQTTAVIDAVQESGSRLAEVGGIAFAGARGIQRVEVRVDEGAWMVAELNRALSALTWVLWRAQVEIPPGRHRLTVRATDGSGTVQTEERRPSHPDGATGYHSKTITLP